MVTSDSEFVQHSAVNVLVTLSELMIESVSNKKFLTTLYSINLNNKYLIYT